MSTGKRVWRAVINHASMVTMATAELIIIIMSPYATGFCSFVTFTKTAWFEWKEEKLWYHQMPDRNKIHKASVGRVKSAQSYTAMWETIANKQYSSIDRYTITR